MSWTDVENAMHEAVQRASGYTSDKVIWSYQDINEPTDDHVRITFGGEMGLGQDWIRYDQDLTRPNGQEIRMDIRGIREVPFDIEVFTATTNGEYSARRVAELIRTKFRNPDIRTVMRRAGVSPFDSGPVNYVPDIPYADFRGRATVTIRCYVPVMDCFEYVGYISRVMGVAYPSGLASPTGATAYPWDSLQASGASGYQYNP